ncbi:hypothetical protein BJX70DRAFT_401861 [Aspergillus crustosus]
MTYTNPIILCLERTLDDQCIALHTGPIDEYLIRPRLDVILLLLMAEVKKAHDVGPELSIMLLEQKFDFEGPCDAITGALEETANYDVKWGQHWDVHLNLFVVRKGSLVPYSDVDHYPNYAHYGWQ